MKIGDVEYKKLLDEYLKEQYNSLERKPNGMMGHWAFQAVKTREFKEKMIQEGRVSENVQAHAKSS